MSDYSDKLKHPKWQRMRLEVFQRADWKCEKCGDDSEQLHAHHKYYSNGREPWEYDPSSLLCLCDTCHTLVHMNQDKVRRFAQVIEGQMLSANLDLFKRLMCIRQAAKRMPEEAQKVIDEILGKPWGSGGKSEQYVLLHYKLAADWMLSGPQPQNEEAK